MRVRHARSRALIRISLSNLFLRCENSCQSAFQFQQLALHLEPAAVTAETTIGRNHAMARHDDGDRVAIVGHAHRTKRVRLAYCAGNLSVAARFSIGDREQSAPAGKLEIGAAQIEWEGELTPVT